MAVLHGALSVTLEQRPKVANVVGEEFGGIGLLSFDALHKYFCQENKCSIVVP